MKYFIFAILFPILGFADAGEEVVVAKKFIPTAFGIKSRTIDSKDAENVVKIVNEYKGTHPKAQITSLEILTCTSDYELPQNTVTNKKQDEHLHLAQERHLMLMAEVSKVTKLRVTGEAKICGPEFSRNDLNYRFVTPESGEIYQKELKVLISNENFVKDLKEQALFEDPAELKYKYQSIFLAKFKPFQGVRLFIKSIPKEELDKPEAKSKLSSGKNQ